MRKSELRETVVKRGAKKDEEQQHTPEELMRMEREIIEAYLRFIHRSQT